MSDAGSHDASREDRCDRPALSESRLSAEVVRELYERYARDLQAYLIGLLRDVSLAGDALQTTFQRLMEMGHTAQRDSIKGWLFKVAFHEAMGLRRREAARGRLLENYQQHAVLQAVSELSSARVLQTEEIERVRKALDALPPDQQEVVRRRIDREQTFATIAEELKLPLGTVLTRMRLASEKLRLALGSE